MHCHQKGSQCVEEARGAVNPVHLWLLIFGWTSPNSLFSLGFVPASDVHREALGMVPTHNAQVCLLVSQEVLTLYEKVLPLVLLVPGLKEQEVQQHAALLVRFSSRYEVHHHRRLRHPY